MSRLKLHLQRDGQIFCWSNRGERVTIDTKNNGWSYQSFDVEKCEEVVLSGVFELTPGTKEVCECEGVENMPKFVARCFIAFGYDLGSIMMLDDVEREEDDDE